MKKIALIAFASILGCHTFAQEIIRPLTESYTISSQRPFNNIKSVGAAASVELPFVDDFSSLGTVPDTALWTDRNVFINGDMAVNPPTIGVATFDGLNANGQAYNLNGGVGLADVLTSKPIDLDYLPEDSIYLSFFYQPQGLVAEPGANDQLRVEFKLEQDSVWDTIWTTFGSSVQPFERVMIPIVDSNYLKDRFEFRFVSEGNLGGQFDTWHIDYVQLDEGRGINDTIIVDGAFTKRHISILNNYQEMPWGHFQENVSGHLADDFKVHMRNLSAVQKNVSFDYEVFDEGVSLYKSSLAADNIDAFGDYEKEYSIDFTFPNSSVAEKSFVLKANLSTSPDVNVSNDTLSHVQKFANYYAYDDGTAELAYGVDAFGARFAYGFEIAKLDTLKAVGIHFVQAGVNTETKPFRITVWQDNNGVPGAVVYQQEDLSYPKFENRINGFAMYELDTTLLLNGAYFIGWQQPQNGTLNVGFDVNNVANEHMYYNMGQGWFESSIAQGSIMIRPVFGSNAPILSNQEFDKGMFSIYPNPANTFINVNLDEGFNYQIIGIQGQLIAQEFNTSGRIDVSNISSGMYFLRITTEGQNTNSQRFIIQR